jgi:hypothetical protein
MKFSILKALPSLAYVRRLIELPHDRASRIDIVQPERTFAEIDSPDPRRTAALIESELPNDTKSIMERLSPTLLAERILILELKDTKSKTEELLPVLKVPQNDTPEPSVPYDLREIELPIDTNSITLNVLPTRQNDLTLMLEPQFEKSKTDKLLPNFAEPRKDKELPTLTNPKMEAPPPKRATCRTLRLEAILTYPITDIE